MRPTTEPERLSARWDAVNRRLPGRVRCPPPDVRVRVTAQVRTEPSWLDGALVVLWEAEAEDGHRIVVEPWMLSAVPVAEVLRRLRPGA